MTIYDRLVQSVENGEYFSVNLETKSLRIRKEMVIDECNYSGELIGDLPCDHWEMLEKLFINYYLSRPGAWSERKKSYFSAKNVKEMIFSQINPSCVPSPLFPLHIKHLPDDFKIQKHFMKYMR